MSMSTIHDKTREEEEGPWLIVDMTLLNNVWKFLMTLHVFIYT